jgi:hypothetical protein
VYGVYIRDCRMLELCKVGTVGQSAGGECIRGRGIVVTGWGMMGEGGEGTGKEWMRRVRRVVGKEQSIIA